MAISVFDLFKIGIGPSSSHTVGPMRAAALFLGALRERRMLARVQRVEVRLYGSLSATGVGHGSDRAVIMGLMGDWPDQIDPAQIEPRIEALLASGQLLLDGPGPVSEPATAAATISGNAKWWKSATRSANASCHANTSGFVASAKYLRRRWTSAWVTSCAMMSVERHVNTTCWGRFGPGFSSARKYPKTTARRSGSK